ncbi:MAG: hypothetical protein JXQ68_01250 [Campylobacterales bacterium]|nr:hypothetical protein [Campylobacterales bacterium]
MKRLLLLFVLTVNFTLNANEETDAKIAAGCKKIDSMHHWAIDTTSKNSSMNHESNMRRK